MIVVWSILAIFTVVPIVLLAIEIQKLIKKVNARHHNFTHVKYPFKLLSVCLPECIKSNKRLCFSCSYRIGTTSLSSENSRWWDEVKISTNLATLSLFADLVTFSLEKSIVFHDSNSVIEADVLLVLKPSSLRYTCKQSLLN